MPTLSALSQREKKRISLLESAFICASETNSARYCSAAHATHQEFFWCYLLSVKMAEAKTSFFIYNHKALNVLKSKFMQPSIAGFFRWQTAVERWSGRQLTEAYVLACVEDTVIPQLQAQHCKNWIMMMHRADVKETHKREELSPTFSSTDSSRGFLACLGSPCVFTMQPRGERIQFALGMGVKHSLLVGKDIQVQLQGVTTKVI